MLTRSGFDWFWQLGIASFLIFIEAIFSNRDRVLAQLTPDNTLGTESSTINKIDRLRDRIDGGATRGANLFHSFQEFNVGEGRGVYFANPTGIENILSRVTGGNPSHILGRLGVLGNANLYLLNPNGILFGPNSSLDIKGSFVATTADGIKLGENGFFSAMEPHKSSLLSVNPGALFFNQVANTPGSIVNQGNLAVGKDLTLSAGNLDLQGQLSASGNLTLQALDTVQIRDSVTNPFIASAEEQLLVQGNQKIDIFALNHPDSGLFAGRDLVLRSANTVGGDAHFWSGGNFRIEKLNGNLGDLYSPHDPIIRANGDVTFNSYTGASLQILAGGSVTIPGFVRIQGADPNNGIVENVTLSDGTIVAIDSRTQPTLDIRAGTTAFGTPVTDTGEPTSADINIGTVVFEDAAGNPLAGTVLLTNQYQPNPALNGNIQVTATEGGSVIVDSKGSFTVNKQILASGEPGEPPFSENGRDVMLLAKGDIIFAPDATIETNGLLGGNVTLKSEGDISFNGGGIISNSYTTEVGGKGGDINLTARSLSFTGGIQVQSITYGKGNAGNITLGTERLLLKDGSLVEATTRGEGNGGNVLVNASESIQLIGTLPDSSFVGGLGTQTFGTGKAGNTIVTTQQLLAKDGAQIFLLAFGEGDGGNLTVDAYQSVQLIGSSTDGVWISGLGTQTLGKGNAGNFTLSTHQLLVRDGAQVQASTFGEGDGGNLTVNASHSVQLIGSLADSRFPSGLSTQANPGATGKAGNLTINTQQLLVRDGAQVRASTFGKGDGGNLMVNADQSVQLLETSADGQTPSGLISATGEEAKAGNLTINTQQLLVKDGAQVFAGTLSEGNGGNLTVNADQSVQLLSESSDGRLGSGLFTSTEGKGKAGNLTINTQQLLVKDGAVVAASTFGEGGAGNLTVNADQSVQLLGTSVDSQFPSGLFAQTQDRGNAGNVTIDTQQLLVQDKAEISSSTESEGNAGDIFVRASDSITLNNESAISTAVNADAVGQGGKIDIQAGSLTLDNRAQIDARSQGQGNAGNITINADGQIAATNSDITTSADRASGGAIKITAKDIRLRSDSDTRTNVASGTGGGGDIDLNADSIVAFDDSDILAFARDGQGGNITLNTPAFFGDRFQPVSMGTDATPLEDNDRVDVNASGAVAGVITIPDVSFVQNSLTELPTNVIDTEGLIAASCVVPNRQQAGTFIITGSGGLPVRPGDASILSYPTGEVRTIPNEESSSRPWQIGDRIVEPQGVYRLDNGRVVLSRECP